jgi:hypothetical protein
VATKIEKHTQKKQLLPRKNELDREQHQKKRKNTESMETGRTINP